MNACALNVVHARAETTEEEANNERQTYHFDKLHVAPRARVPATRETCEGDQADKFEKKLTNDQ
jgi:hypothetical protein